MDVTLDVLDIALENIPAVRTRRVQDLAEAAVYGMADGEGRKQMYEVWNSHIEAQANQTTPSAQKGRFTINGKPTNSKGLRYWLATSAGWGKKIHG